MAKSEGTPAATATEQKIEEFAEDLGRLLGSAQAKAEGWLGQRQQIAKTLSGIRDTATDLLSQLTGEGSRVVAAVRRGRGRASVAASPKKAAATTSEPVRRTMSAKARRAISRAQKARWARQRAAAKKN